MATLTLVAGISGAGKTTFANSRGVPVISYDKLHNYSTGKTEYAPIENISRNTILDAWNIYDDPDLNKLQALIDPHRLDIIYLYTTPLQLHLAQLSKYFDDGMQLSPQRLLMGPGTRLLSEEMKQFVELPLAARTSYVYRNRTNVSQRNQQHYLETADTNPERELLSWIENISGDPHYQTIAVQGKTLHHGTAKSQATWYAIQTLNLNWKDHSVADLGCFNGYFSIKASSLGARVTAYDNNLPAIEIAKALALLNVVRVEVVQQDLVSTPLQTNFDRALLLGSFHHIAAKCPDKGAALLQRLSNCCNEVLATVDQVDLNFFVRNLGMEMVSRLNVHPTKAEGPRQLVLCRK